MAAIQSRPLAVTAVAVGWLLSALQPAAAQEVLNNVPLGTRLTTSEATLSLSSGADVRVHYDQLQRSLRQLNADELARLYAEYTAALADLREENAEYLAALFEANRTSHETLRNEDVDSGERSRRSQEIQNTYAAETAKLRAWYTDSQRALAAGYESARNQNRVLLDTEVSALSLQMDTALAGLRAGAGSITVPAEVALPRSAALPGPALAGAATAPLAGDERVQAALPDIVLHSIQIGVTSRENQWSFGYPGYIIELTACTRPIRFIAGYSVFLGDSPTEEQIQSVPITGVMRIGQRELVRIDEQPYFAATPRRVADIPNPMIEEPHGFGWIRADLDIGLGEHVVTVVIDDANRVIESNENNNTQTFSIRVIPDTDGNYDCTTNTIMSEAVPDDSPASGRVADVGNTGSNVAIPDENAARAALSQANLVLELDSPMSRFIRVSNTGRTATNASAMMTISCRTGAGDPCRPSERFLAELAEPVEIPPLEPGATYEHRIAGWPHQILWGPGRYDFEVELNANSAVAESARGNYMTSSLVGADHPADVIADYCQGCHRSDDRGDGPAPQVLVDWEAEDGLDALVQAVIEGPTGMGAKAEIFWLPDSRVPDVVGALLDRGR